MTEASITDPHNCVGWSVQGGREGIMRSAWFFLFKKPSHNSRTIPHNFGFPLSPTHDFLPRFFSYFLFPRIIPAYFPPSASHISPPPWSLGKFPHREHSATFWETTFFCVSLVWCCDAAPHIFPRHRIATGCVNPIPVKLAKVFCFLSCSSESVTQHP